VALVVTTGVALGAVTLTAVRYRRSRRGRGAPIAERDSSSEAV
jgi:hypothetical protein